MTETSITRNLRICYGYRRDGDGQITVDCERGQIVRLIFEKYLGGHSLGGVQSFLKSMNITSPSGKDAWTRAALDKLLSNKSYVPHMVSAEQFDMVQAEKQRRSNVQQENNQSFRKSTRYNSNNVLSGLLVCEECGANYRRITKPDGAIVWRYPHLRLSCEAPFPQRQSAVATFRYSTLPFAIANKEEKYVP